MVTGAIAPALIVTSNRLPITFHSERRGAQVERAVYAGDDDTDADAFRALRRLGVALRASRAERQILASQRLPDVRAMETLLRWVAER